jgi:hypothetical protein
MIALGRFKQSASQGLSGKADLHGDVGRKPPVEISRMVELSDLARRSEASRDATIDVNRPYLIVGETPAATALSAITSVNANRRAF